MLLHKVEREDLIGTEWPEKISQGVYCDILGSTRLLCVVTDSQQGEMFDCFTQGKIAIAPCAMGCSLYLVVKIGDSKTLGISVDPKESLNEHGKPTFFMNKVKVRRKEYTLNYAHLNLENGKPIIKELRKLKFDTGLYKCLDQAIERSLSAKHSVELFERQVVANSRVHPETVMAIKKPCMYEELNADQLIVE